MRTHNILQKNDVPVPESYLFHDEESMYQAVSRLLDEHSKVWMRATRGAGSKAALPVTNFKQAHSWLQYWQTTKSMGYDSFMVSEYLPGTDYAFTSVWREGKLITSAVRERLMYLYGFLSPSGTSSTPSVAKSVHNKSVNSICTRAIKAIDPNASGIFCVDLKSNSEGTPCVTEINSGRFFTTSNFFTHAGSNMPLIYIKLGFGEEVKDAPQYDAIPANLYWVRMVDMGYKLLKEDEFKSKSLVRQPEGAHGEQ
jgi:carbamoyl-phosphate synthase large subunit